MVINMNVKFKPSPIFTKCEVPIQIGDIIKTNHGCEGFVTEISLLSTYSVRDSIEGKGKRNNVSISFNWEVTKQGRGSNASPVGTITCGYLHSKVGCDHYEKCNWFNHNYGLDETVLDRNNPICKSAFSDIHFFANSAIYKQIGKNLFNGVNCTIAPDNMPTNYYVEKMNRKVTLEQDQIHSEQEKKEKRKENYPDFDQETQESQDQKKKDFLDVMERLYNSVGELDKLIKECQNLKTKLNEILEK